MTRIPVEPGKRSRPWFAADTRRASTAERGYGARWQQESEVYRKKHPVCVPCLLVDRVRPSQCVDHIVPADSCPSLFWEASNWCAMCFRCHGRKTRLEPQHSWQPRPDRLVVCGLPGVGKTTFAKASGFPYWDADDYPELVTSESIVAARERWLDQQRSSRVVIVASPITASQLAARIGGMVVHLTERRADRPPQPRAA